MLPLIPVSCHCLYMATTGNNCIGGGSRKSQFPEIIRKPHSRPTILGAILTDASLLFAWGSPICKLTGKHWLVRELP
jgi:hypothetical protein